MSDILLLIKFLLHRGSLTLRFATLSFFLWVFLPLQAGAAQDDIRLIIDISGSMKKNDPRNLRIPAVNLLVKLVPKGASAGVWVFGQDVKMLVPHGKVDSAWKKNAMAKIRMIDSSGLYTNIGAALEQVMLDDEMKRGGTAILLTDGMVDISKDKTINILEQQRIIQTLLPALVSAGSQVHTVALSENADAMLMRELALSTGGIFDTASNADDLTRIFLRMFDDAVNQDRLPLDHGKFVVDSSVEEFTLLVFRTADQIPAQLRDPAGEFFLAGSQTDSVNWYSDTGYELITALQPLEGEWQLFADADDQNRVTVLSDLKLSVSNLPNTIYEGDVPEIFISFRNESRLVTDAKFLDLMDVQLIIEKPDGKRVGAKLPTAKQGVYRSRLDLLDTTGRYKITVSVDGKTFKRENFQEVQYEKPVKIKYLAAEKLLKVIPVSQSLFIDKVNVIATITAKGGKKRILPLQMTDSIWQGSLDFFKQGKYRISLQVRGESSAGQKVDFVMPPMIIRIGDVSSGIVEPVDTESVSENEDGEDLEGLEALEDEEVDPDVMTLVKAYWIYLAGAMAGLILIAGIVWFLLRRRKAAAAAPKEAAVKPEPEPVTEEPTDTEEAADDDGDDEDFGSGMSDIVDAWGDDPLENVDKETDEPAAEKEPQPEEPQPEEPKPEAESDDEDKSADATDEIPEAEKTEEVDPEAMFMPDGLSDDERFAEAGDKTPDPVEAASEQPLVDEITPEESAPEEKPPKDDAVKPAEEPLMTDEAISQLIKDELPEEEEEEDEPVKDPDVEPNEAAEETAQTDEAAEAAAEDPQEDWDEQDELASTKVMTPDKKPN